MEKELKDILIKDLGFSLNHAEVYMFLRKHNSVKIRDIVEETKIARTTVHNILKDLDKRDLLTILHSSKEKWYVIEPPERLMDLIEIEYQQKRLAVKRLISKFNIGPFNIKYWSGVVGLIKHRENILNTKEDIIDIFNYDHVQAFLDKTSTFEDIREKEPTYNFNLENLYSSKNGSVRPNHSDKEKNYFSKDIEFGAEVAVFDRNKVVVIDYDSKPITTVVIENDNLAKTIKGLFLLAKRNL